MSDVFFLVLRRLRLPLILLVTVYAVAVTGMTLIPGADADGNPVQMSFFHAFYFVSFMGTTIGFGEIPHPFTDQQRLWVLVFIYVSVIAWLYAIGTLLRLVQDPMFQAAVADRVFRRAIEKQSQDFYIICGYGDTGRLIARGLAQLNTQSVIIDADRTNLGTIELSELYPLPITVCGDITDPSVLMNAGIKHEHCRGVIAVTEDDHTNLNVAVSVKLLSPSTRVICRSEIEDEERNMRSFNTDSTINPFQLFSSRLEQLIDNHAKHRVHSWLVNQYSKEYINLEIAKNGLPRGHWVVCGYGRLGRAVTDILERLNVQVTVLDPDPIRDDGRFRFIAERGTEAQTLKNASIESASVIVAASDDDANNLSTLMTARSLNAQLYSIGRVNKEANHRLYLTARCDYVMRRSQLVSNEVLTLISRPLVSRFLEQVSADTLPELIEQIERLCPDDPPITSRLTLDAQCSPALFDQLALGRLTVADVVNTDEQGLIQEIPLFLARRDANEKSLLSTVLPTLDTQLLPNDQLLLCHARHALPLAVELANNAELVNSRIGGNPHTIPLWRAWYRYQQTLKHS